jgi:polysaccharide biosynthesis/export protein
MKNFVSKNKLWPALAAARWLAPLLALLFTITGCQTQSSGNYPTPSPSESSKPVQSEPMILRAGDTVTVSFPSSPSLDTSQQIRRDGKIVMPLVGEVAAAGKTPDELQKELIKLYEPQVASKQVIVTVQSSAYQVYITGAVLRPGPITVDHPISALEAIMEAGGFDYTKANVKAVVVIRQEKDRTVRYTLNLKHVLTGTRTSDGQTVFSSSPANSKQVMTGTQVEPFYLQPSDIVFVPERFTWF